MQLHVPSVSSLATVSSLTPVDVNRDGWVDVVLTTSLNVSVLLNVNGSLVVQRTWTTASRIQAAAFGDITGDGSVDVVVATGGAM